MSFSKHQALTVLNLNVTVCVVCVCVCVGGALVSKHKLLNVLNLYVEMGKKRGGGGGSTGGVFFLVDKTLLPNLFQLLITSHGLTISEDITIQKLIEHVPVFCPEGI